MSKRVVQSIVLVEEPVVEVIQGPEPVERGASMTHNDITMYAADLRKRGFGENAIVTRRSHPIYDMRQPKTWGVVKDLRTYRGVSEYLPLLIVWLADGKTTQEWEDELLVVYPAMNWQDMDKNLRAQM